MLFEKSREFVYRNARPLDFSLWRYFFENGTQEDVLEKLAFYQNKDGGFGHALEADMWNPNSIPLGTWKATEILAKIGFKDASHSLIKGALRYLAGGDGFDQSTQQWTYTRPTNNDFPHAIWWEHKENPKFFNPNPNAALAGFIIAYADERDSIYETGIDMLSRCYDFMVDSMERFNIIDEHTIACYIRLYEYLVQSGHTSLVDMEKFKACLRQMVDASLCMDIDKWGKEYVPMPSTFISSPESFLYHGKEELVKKECQLIKKQQLEDGSYIVPWNWCTDYKEYEVAKNWWKSELIINKLLFLKNFGEL